MAVDPVGVEPVVNEEKLRHLLALQAEYPTLDYKGSCQIDGSELVDLAKDVGAMSVRGGFIVVGADDRGGPTAGVSPKQAPLFDESRLRPKLLKWLPDSLEIHSQVHSVHGNFVALIYVAPNPAGCAFFRATGNRAGKKSAFAEGDVYFRDGTQSRPLNQRGFEQIVEQRLAIERERWEAARAGDLQHLVEELRTGDEGRRVARGSAAELNFALEPDVLQAAVVELLRANDEIPLKRLLTRSPQEARELIERGAQEELERLLDRLACLGATFLDLDLNEWFTRVVNALVAIYGLPWEHGPIGDDPPAEAARIWLAVVERAFALGACATRLENWDAVAYLIAQRDGRMHRIYPSWLKHAVTMAFRAHVFDMHEGGEVSKVSLLSLARGHIRRLECLRLDIASEDERALDSLAQFDLLTSVAGAYAGRDLRSTGFYTNFARFSSRRIDPIAELLVTDPELREAVFPHSDEDLARALVTVSQMAAQESMMYDGWSGYESDAVREFLTAHFPDEE